MQHLEVSSAARPLYGSLGVKGLRETKVSLPRDIGFPLKHKIRELNRLEYLVL